MRCNVNVSLYPDILESMYLHADVFSYRIFILIYSNDIFFFKLSCIRIYFIEELKKINRNEES